MEAPSASTEKGHYFTASEEKKAAAYTESGPQHHPAFHDHVDDPAPPYEASRTLGSQQAYAQPPNISDGPAYEYQQAQGQQQAMPIGQAIPQHELKPITIPQICNSKGAPFVRAYAPELASLGISEAEFIKFVDSLNEAAQSNSALSALDVTGGALRKVPILGLFGAPISGLSKFGNAAASKSGMLEHVATMSETVFKPKGLEVAVCTGKVLASRIGSIGDSLLAPLDANVPAVHQLTVWQRRMSGLRGRAAELRETTLPVSNSGLAQKLKSDGVLHQAEREEQRLMHDRRTTLKSRIRGRHHDEEEIVAEQMLWLLIEPIRAGEA